MKKRILTFCCILLVIFTIQSSVFASIKLVEYTDYFLGMCCADMALIAEGNTSNHVVYEYFHQQWTGAFNSFEGTTKWKTQYPTYTKVSLTSSHMYGIPTPWGTVGWTNKAVYLYLTF